MSVMWGAFTGVSHEPILLAEDEARMLGQVAVAPEHLLLALTRRETGQSLLGGRGVTGTDIHSAIVRRGGLGDELVLGTVPRARATDAVLEAAFDIAAQRGVLGPRSEYLLLAIAAESAGPPSAILREVGIHDVPALVDSISPVRRDPISAEALRRFPRIGLQPSAAHARCRAGARHGPRREHRPGRDAGG
jgi:ATP-dependent Clp protease ATP-binding subunit ClpA